MEDLFFYFLVGMVGGEIANKIAKNDTKFKMPFQLVFSMSFSTLYIIGLLFFTVTYIFKGYEIPWRNLGLFCIIIALIITVVISILEKYYKNR